VRACLIELPNKLTSRQCTAKPPVLPSCHCMLASSGLTPFFRTPSAAASLSRIGGGFQLAHLGPSARAPAALRQHRSAGKLLLPCSHPSMLFGACGVSCMLEQACILMQLNGPPTCRCTLPTAATCRCFYPSPLAGPVLPFPAPTCQKLYVAAAPGNGVPVTTVLRGATVLCGGKSPHRLIAASRRTAPCGELSGGGGWGKGQEASYAPLPT